MIIKCYPKLKEEQWHTWYEGKKQHEDPPQNKRQKWEMYTREWQSWVKITHKYTHQYALTSKVSVSQTKAAGMGTSGLKDSQATHPLCTSSESESSEQSSTVVIHTLLQRHRPKAWVNPGALHVYWSTIEYPNQEPMGACKPSCPQPRKGHLCRILRFVILCDSFTSK